MKKRNAAILIVIIVTIITSTSLKAPKKSGVLENALLFALVPPPLLANSPFGHQMETFGNHTTGMREAPRGGDLCLMDVQGDVRFLTKEAGFGVDSGEPQRENAIAVRQPCIHWSGSKALFSMIIGGPSSAFDQSYRQNRWQIYEIINLDAVVAGQVADIVKVPNQSEYNNISPIYGSDDQIIYTSDAPLFDMHHTYPQMDEYESTATNTGIFKLDPETGKTIHLTHSPSGDFDIHLASDGRIISTRWEHLKRDQQASNHRAGNTQWEPVNYESESTDAEIVHGEPTIDGKPYADGDGTPYEIFPEAFVHIENGINVEPNRDPNEPLHDFNEFLPWEITENGERHQTINHAGRHEFGGVFQHGSKIDDPNLVFSLGNFSNNKYRETVGSDAGLFQIKEDPRPGKEGTFYGTWAREFSRFASGRILEFELPIGANPQDMEIVDWSSSTIDNEANNKGHFRNPIMLMDGTMLVSYTSQSLLYNSDNVYHFQISAMQKMNNDNNDTEHVACTPFTGVGIERDIVYWGDSTTPISVLLQMNEVDVVEIVPRTRPNARPEYEIAEIEKQILDEENVNEEELRTWMIENNLALIAIRNITERDQGESQQPFNLQVPGGVSTIPKSGKVYDISHFQIFGGEMIRGYGLRNYEGRRTIATPLRNNEANPNIKGVNLFDTSGPESSVKIGADGSVAAFVPATRALTWQTVAPDGEPIVRERQWITFAPGEIRTCEGCHGINDKTQAGNLVPENKPEALRELLIAWKNDFEGLVTGVETEAIKKYVDEIDQFVLYDNYPNPFNKSTAIKYKIGKTSNVSVKVMNALGQEVALLERTFHKPKGEYTLEWNGIDNDGKQVEVGVYFYQIKANEKTLSKKLILQ